MKRNIFKKMFTVVLAVVLCTATLAGCGKGTDSSKAEPTQTIMWLSNLSSGIAYDSTCAYAEMICEELGYKFKVVYGDQFNDPAANLSAVKNAMTDDVVAIISSQDGGLSNIMSEYPDLYVCGYNSSLASVFDEGGASAACLSNEKFLGTIVDGYAHGSDIGHAYAEAVIEQGYKKVSVITFPGYAYPELEVASAEFRTEIEEYNKTASEKIEIVGDTKVLEFQPLNESYFLEDGYDDLDAIVAICAGTMFVYPTMITAISSGTCGENTKLLTGGFDDDPSIIEDICGDGVIQWLSISPAEDIAYSLIMLDNALNGKKYSDFTAPEQLDPIPYVIDSTDDIDNTMSSTLAGTGDASKALLNIDEIKDLCLRFNDSATYADLVDTFTSEKLTPDSFN